MKTSTSRESNYDILRIFCAYLIVLIHSSIQGSPSWALSSVAIPLFVMLSGAFILNRKIEPYKTFYFRGIKNLGIPFIAFSIFYIFFDWFIYYFNADKFETPPSYWTPIIGLFTGGTFYHMWYMYMLVGLYLAAPVIIRIKEEISPKSYIILAICFLIYGCIIGCTNRIEIWPINAIQYMGYFMVGGIMKQIKPSTIKENLMLIFGACAIAALAWYMFNNLQIKWATGYLSPIMALLAVVLFRITSGIKLQENSIITVLSSSSLFIYLFHPFILAIILRLNRLLSFNSHLESQTLFGLLVSLFTFVICFICYSLMQYISYILTSKKLKTNTN